MKMVKALAILGVVGTAAAFTLNMNGDNQKKAAIVDRRGFVGASVAGVAGVAAATFKANPALADEDPYADFTTTESGMKYKITKEGDGAIPVSGQQVKAQYTGWLDGFDSIKKFDSSRDRGRPFSFKVGAGQVIKGWDVSVDWSRMLSFIVLQLVSDTSPF